MAKYETITQFFQEMTGLLTLSFFNDFGQFKYNFHAKDNQTANICCNFPASKFNINFENVIGFGLVVTCVKIVKKFCCHTEVCKAKNGHFEAIFSLSNESS